MVSSPSRLPGKLEGKESNVDTINMIDLAPDTVSLRMLPVDGRGRHRIRMRNFAGMKVWALLHH